MVSATRRTTLGGVGRKRAAGVVVAVFALAWATTGPTVAAAGQAQPSGAAGEAYGHYTNVSLFGGPAVPIGPDPQVELPARGSSRPVSATDSDGAIAQYGPARIFAGIWPQHAAQAPPSGPITVRTQGTPGKSVTSTVDIGLYPRPPAVPCDNDPPGKTSCNAPGGFGPMPVTQGEKLHSTCTATSRGVTGEATFSKAQIAKTTDADGEPTGIEDVPDRPPVGFTETGIITNVGDNWRIVFNEQTRDPDGSLTVNAIHMFLLGPIAKGEQIVGHVRCSMTAAAGTSTGGSNAAASTGSSSNTGVIVLAVAAVVIVALIVALVLRRRKTPPPAPAPPPP